MGRIAGVVAGVHVIVASPDFSENSRLVNHQRVRGRRGG
jgi:hypothetical protein